MNVADKVFQILKDHDIDTVFYLPGGGAMYLVDALGRSGLRMVELLTEQQVGFAALGYAMFKESWGVALVTSGPGSTNIITPVAAAWTDSVPLLVISGQARSDTLIKNSGMRTSGVQEIDIISIVESITKVRYEMCPEEIDFDEMQSMLDYCMHGRKGPIWLSVPLDVQNLPIEG